MTNQDVMSVMSVDRRDRRDIEELGSSCLSWRGLWRRVDIRHDLRRHRLHDLETVFEQLLQLLAGRRDRLVGKPIA